MVNEGGANHMASEVVDTSHMVSEVGVDCMESEVGVDHMESET